MSERETAKKVTDEENAEMSWGCLDMVKEALERVGEDMSATPAMMYEEAIYAAVQRNRWIATRKALEEAIEIAETEPEPDGPCPFDIDDPVELVCATVRATKKCIADRIRVRLKEKPIA